MCIYTCVCVCVCVCVLSCLKNPLKLTELFIPSGPLLSTTRYPCISMGASKTAGTFPPPSSSPSPSSPSSPPSLSGVLYGFKSRRCLTRGTFFPADEEEDEVLDEVFDFFRAGACSLGSSTDSANPPLWSVSLPALNPLPYNANMSGVVGWGRHSKWGKST